MSISSPFDPVVDEVNAPFYEGAAAGELRIQCCSSCSRHRHPPQRRCPSCHSDQVAWTTSSGKGTIFSFVVAHPPLPTEFARLAPLAVALVELDDLVGIRLVGTLLDTKDAPIAIGDRVEVAFESVAGGPLLPHYRLA